MTAGAAGALWEDWKLAQAYKEAAKGLAQTLGVRAAAEWLEKRGVPVGVAVEWLARGRER